MLFKQVFRLNKMTNLPRKKRKKIIRKKATENLLMFTEQVLGFIRYYIKDPLDKVVTDGDGSVRHTNWYEAICSCTPLSSSAALRRA